MNESVDPLDLYILPPIKGASLQVGDLLEGKACQRDGFWLLLTPTCDFVQAKADYGLLAACEPLEDTGEYKNWKKSEDGSSDRATATKRLRGLFTNRREKVPADRFYYLPGVGSDLPHLLVDFQQTHATPSSALAGLTVIATVTYPFAGAVVAQFLRYFGRVGTPDLDLDKLIAGLT